MTEIRSPCVSPIPENRCNAEYRLNMRLGKKDLEAIALSIELQIHYIILDAFTARKKATRLRLNLKKMLPIIKKLNQT